MNELDYVEIEIEGDSDEEDQKKKKCKKIGVELGSKARINPRKSTTETHSSQVPSCDGDVCTFNPNQFNEPPASFSQNSNSMSSSPSRHVQSSAPKSTCDGDVCTFNPNRFDEPVLTKIDNTNPNDQTNIFTFSNNKPSRGSFKNCINDVCVTAFQDARECVDEEGSGICEKRSDTFVILLKQVVTKSKESLGSQFVKVHEIGLKSLCRTSGELIVYYDNYNSIIDAIYDLLKRIGVGVTLQISTKTIYDSTVEMIVQFCCGEKTYDYIPGLDKFMGAYTVITCINVEKRNPRFGLMIGVKELCKTYGSVVLASTINTFAVDYVGEEVSPYFSALMSSFVVNLIDRGIKAVLDWWSKNEDVNS